MGLTTHGARPPSSITPTWGTHPKSCSKKGLTPPQLHRPGLSPAFLRLGAEPLPLTFPGALPPASSPTHYPGLQNPQLCPCWAWTSLGFYRQRIDHPGLPPRGFADKGARPPPGPGHHGKIPGFSPQAFSRSGSPSVYRICHRIFGAHCCNYDLGLHRCNNDFGSYLCNNNRGYHCTTDTTVAFVMLSVTLLTS
jgi:hypothetical protein